MNPKTTKLLYWSVTILFAVFMLMDGVAGTMRVKDGQNSMRLLGYPVYLLSIIGAAKILGALAVLLPVPRTLKEWAYAGFAFNFLGAAVSWAFVGNTGFNFIFPFIILALMLASYFLWKRLAKARERPTELPAGNPMGASI